MCQYESSELSDSGALGFYSVLMKVHEPILESIFWLALGCALGWQDKECVMRDTRREGHRHPVAQGEEGLDRQSGPSVIS